MVIDALFIDELVEAVEEAGGRYCFRGGTRICGLSLASAHIVLELLPKFFVRHLAMVIFISVEVLLEIGQGLVDFIGRLFLPVLLLGLDFLFLRILF